MAPRRRPPSRCWQQIEVAAHMVDDLDRRLGQIDQAVEESAKRGRTNIALSALEGSAALAGERAKPASALARASVAAKEGQADTEAPPIRYAAKLFGIGGDGEKSIRLLILRPRN